MDVGGGYRKQARCRTLRADTALNQRNLRLERHDLGIRELQHAAEVVGMPVRVDDVRHLKPLIAGSLDADIGRIRRVDEDRAARSTIAEEVGEVPVAPGAYLFEDELHDASVAARDVRSRCLAAEEPDGILGS